MKSAARYYLARNQKVMGPISNEEVQALRQSGQILNYTWICKEGDDQWSPIDPAPALPSAPRRARIEKETYRFVLFNRTSALSGWLLSATDKGCEIQSDQNGSDPIFTQKGAGFLTLHHCRTGESIKIPVKVAKIRHIAESESHPGGWQYQLEWKSTPSLLTRPELNASA
jgi:GYF domain 2